MQSFPVWPRTDGVFDCSPFLELFAKVFDFSLEVFVLLCLSGVSHVLHFQVCLQTRQFRLPYHRRLTGQLQQRRGCAVQRVVRKDHSETQTHKLSPETRCFAP